MVRIAVHNEQVHSQCCKMNIKISITVCFLVTGEEKHPVNEHMMLYNLWHKFSTQTSEHSLYTEYLFQDMDSTLVLHVLNVGGPGQCRVSEVLLDH